MRTSIITFFLCGVAGLLTPGCGKSSAPGSKSEKGARSSDAGGDAVLLEVKWPVGNRYVQRMTLAQNAETTIPQNAWPIKQDVSMGQDYAITVVKERPGGGRELELEFLAVDMNVSVGGRPVIEFDSKGESIDDGGNPMVAGFRKLVGAHVKFLTDSSNNVEKIEGFKEFRDKVASGPGSAQAMTMFDSMFNEDYLKQMMGYNRALPGKPVKIGDSWPLKFDLTMGPLGKLSLEMNYTFKGWEEHDQRKCALLEFTGTMESKGPPGPGTMGMNMSVQNGTSAGRSWFDPALGSIIESSIDQSMNITMTFAQPPAGAPPGQAPPQGPMNNRTNQKIVVKLTQLAQAGK